MQPDRLLHRHPFNLREPESSVLCLDFLELELVSIQLKNDRHGTNEEGHTTVTLLQDQSIEKMHTAFKEYFDERERVRRKEIKVPM